MLSGYVRGWFAHLLITASPESSPALTRAAKLLPSLLIFALLAPQGSVLAQQRPALDIAAEFIVGNCYRAIDDISRVKSLARLMKWKELPPDALNIIKPVDGADYAGWRVDYEGQLFIVGVNIGSFRGRRADACSVVANLAAGDVRKRLLGSLKATKVHEEKDGVQLVEIYELRQHPTLDTAFMTITAPIDDRRAPVIVSFMGSR